jgi:hypothetical protein
MILIAAVGMVLESLFLAVPWRIILASFIAIVLSETADTEVYHKLLQRSWFQRVLGSNLVSIPLDSILFNVIAFAGVFEPGMMVAIIFGEIVVKFTTGAVAALWRSQDKNVSFQMRRPLRIEWFRCRKIPPHIIVICIALCKLDNYRLLKGGSKIVKSALRTLGAGLALLLAVPGSCCRRKRDASRFCLRIPHR